jgi:hypothetical protein
MRVLLAALTLGTLLAVSFEDASACACCTDRGQRNVGMQEFDSGKRAQVDEMAFAPGALLYTGEGDLEFVQGIASPESEYALAVSRDAASLTFALTGRAGRAGTLTLRLPKRISIFEVDPRDTADSGLGPALYKEWRLTGDVMATGRFAAAGTAGHKATLILHGSGNSCTSSSDFSHWSLVMEGPTANYMLLGDLVQQAP